MMILMTLQRDKTEDKQNYFSFDVNFADNGFQDHFLFGIYIVKEKLCFDKNRIVANLDIGLASGMLKWCDEQSETGDLIQVNCLEMDYFNEHKNYHTLERLYITLPNDLYHTRAWQR